MLAKMYGLAGQGIFEEAQADSLFGLMKNFVNVVKVYVKELLSNHPEKTGTVEAKKLKTMFLEIFEPAVEKYFGILEGHASQNGGFLLPSGVSYVDFGVVYMFEFIYRLHPEVMSKYSSIRAITHRVSTLPQLQKYLANRRRSEW